MKDNGVIGLYTCSCHLFANYEDAKKAAKQKFQLGQKVKNRCDKIKGTVYKILDRGYLIIKYGDLPKDRHLMHVQELIKVE